MLKTPDKSIVINTGPIIALITATGSLKILERHFSKVVVPYEVVCEIMPDNRFIFGSSEFINNDWIEKRIKPVKIDTYLANSLDKGEASVIQTAVNEDINTVCIDEVVGRRIARLAGLNLTGSLGIIISSINKGERIEIDKAIKKMREKGIWISKELELEANKLIKKN